jgi:hypothetical protein
MKQTVPRWLTTDDAIIAAYAALVDKVCPCVLLLHSQGGAFGFKVAEMAGQGQGDRGYQFGDRRDRRQRAKFENTPVLMVFGDYVDQHPRWATFKNRYGYGNAIRPQAERSMDQPSRHRHQGQFPHDDAGQEQRADCRRHQKWLVSRGSRTDRPRVNVTCGSEPEILRNSRVV